jgi:RNA polymerase sigma factor (TIGR02999 family)
MAVDGSPKSPASEPSAKSSELLEQVYRELRAVAGAQLAREAPGHTLQATALVHEVFLKLQRHPALVQFDASRFFDAAAQAMRRVLIDHARTRGRVKRGGGTKREFTDVADLAADQDPAEILALDEAIDRLEQDEPQAARVVKLRFFAGLSVPETARVMELSERTIKREWRYARAWLFHAMS